MSVSRVPLSPQHRAHLKTAGISDEVIEERRYQTVGRTPNDNRGRDLLKRLRIPGWARRDDTRYPGLLIPMYRATGELISWQYRPDSPPTVDGKVRRYASPVGRTNLIDVHPRNRGRIADPTQPLWITEGVKKGDALTTAGACVVTLTGVFNWRSRLGSLGDWEDIPLKGRHVNVCFDADANTNANVARAMQRLGQWLKSKGATVRYVVVPEEMHGAKTKGADDYLNAGGTLASLIAAGSAKPPAPDKDRGEWSDAMLAEVFAEEVLADRFCWTAGLGWLQWNGQRWSECVEAAVIEEARRYVVDRFKAALEERADSRTIDGLNSLLNAGRIKTILGLSKGTSDVLRDAADFDQDPDVLNTPSGVVDLATGKVMPHDPSLLMTKMTSVGYDPDAEHPDWTAALAAVREDAYKWLQIRLGQACTGHTPPDDILVVSQGGGENGKTTIFTGVSRALGDYHTLISDRVLLADPSSHPTELMDLRGARFALIEETPEARRLSVARLKKTVGTPQISARHVYKNSVTFDATHSLFLTSNYRPLIEETDHGTWRRLALLHFPFRFLKDGEPLTGENDRRGDPGLRDRVRDNDDVHRAVLRYLVDGARAWYEAERVMTPLPPSVSTDTRAWRAESDLILAYWAERLEPDRDRHVMATDLLDDFNEWLGQRGHPKWSDRTFVTRFGDHDETAAHRVVRRRESRSEALDRRPSVWATAAPERYHAWAGVKFARKPKNAPDQGEHQDLDGMDGTSGIFPIRAAERKVAAMPSMPSSKIVWDASERRDVDSPTCPECSGPVAAGQVRHPACMNRPTG